jgi:DNA-3-methyladenine glycosylase
VTLDRQVTLVPLGREFYHRATLAVAADLVGKVLVHRAPRGLTAGMIVEVEAYVGEEDPACHASAGPTRRNAPMYGEPGHAYVYLNYGVHALFNIVTEAAGSPAAVLVRALAPLEGLALMRRRRARYRGASRIPDGALCRGPGNMARAMGITLRDNGVDLCGSPLTVEDRGFPSGPLVWGPRIGITAGAEKPWRCSLAGHPSVSGSRHAPPLLRPLTP